MTTTVKGSTLPNWSYNVKDSGATAGGTTDDTASIQAAIALCAASGRSLYFPAGTYLISGNLYFYGSFDIIGDGNTTTVWKSNLLTGVGQDTNKYHIVFGTASFGGAGDPWNGIMSNIGIETTASSTFERCLFILSCARGHFDNLRWDFTASDHTAAGEGGPIESGPNSTWASGGTITHGTFKLTNSRADLNHGQGASEGLGLSDWDDARIENCQCYGAADDVFVIHFSDIGVIRNNRGTAIDGRILIDSVKRYTIEDNNLTRIQDPHTTTWHEATFIQTTVSGTGTTRAANEIGIISGNVLEAPSGADVAYWIRGLNNQLALTVENNTFYNESSAGNATCISIESGTTEQGVGWTGPSGNPDEANSGVVRVRQLTIRNNKDAGPLRSGLVQTSGTATNFLDSCIVEGNDAEDYDMAIPQGVFSKTNRAESSQGIQSVSSVMCTEANREVFTFTALDNTYLVGSPLVTTPVSTVLRAGEAGRIMGVEIATDQVGTSGEQITVNVKVDGSSKTTANMVVTSNTQQLTSFTGTTGLTVTAGALITVEAYCSTSQAVGLKGSVTLIIQPSNV